MQGMRTGSFYRNCPLCGRSGGQVLYQHRGRIVRCVGCGLVRRDPVPPSDVLRALYSSEQYFRLGERVGIGYADYYADESIYRPYFRRAFRTLARYSRPPGRLLEIGVAAGYALVEARGAGWETYGVELSPAAARYARERFSLRVEEGDFASLRAGADWDVVCAFQTIEHVVDVRMALRRIRRALRPGGVLFLVTPDHGSALRRMMRGAWINYRPEHVVYFDRGTLRRMLEEEGFRIELLTAGGPLLAPLQRIVERLVHYSSGRRFEPRWIPLIRLPVWLGDVQVIARGLGIEDRDALGQGAQAVGKLAEAD